MSARLKAQIRPGFPGSGRPTPAEYAYRRSLCRERHFPAYRSAVTYRLEALLPDVRRLDIAGGTHNIFDGDPTEFNAGVLEFIGMHNS